VRASRKEKHEGMSRAGESSFAGASALPAPAAEPHRKRGRHQLWNDKVRPVVPGRWEDS